MNVQCGYYLIETFEHIHESCASFFDSSNSSEGTVVSLFTNNR